TVLGIFSAIYYYYPKITGLKLNETLGKWHFWLFLIGSHVTFFPMHLTGLNGMPRTPFTYDAREGITTRNCISTHSACLMGISILFRYWNLVKTHWENKKVGPAPWDGRTLEWTVDSPSPENTFEPMPVVDDLNPLAKAKSENRKMETTNEHRASPIARDSII